MTKDSGHSDDNGGGGQLPPTAPRRNNVLPIDRGRGVARRSWPITTSAISLNSAAGLLIVIGVLCGLLISESDRKSLIDTPSPDARVQTKPSAPVQTAKPAKPSPAIALGTAKAGDSVVTKEPASRTPNPAASYTPARFQATHKKVFGGCTGELELTRSALHFRCPKQDLDLPINAIASANKDGVVLKSGEKYHFAIANHTKDQTEAIFIAWLSRTQLALQQNSAF